MAYKQPNWVIKEHDLRFFFLECFTPLFCLQRYSSVCVDMYNLIVKNYYGVNPNFYYSHDSNMIILNFTHVSQSKIVVLQLAISNGT